MVVVGRRSSVAGISRSTFAAVVSVSINLLYLTPRSFLEAADDYGLDWRLLPSISYIESSGGKAAPHNNLFGWDSGKAQFHSPTASIHTIGYRLAYSPRYRDKTVDELLATYNPVPEYVQKVKFVMRRISPAE